MKRFFWFWIFSMMCVDVYAQFFDVGNHSVGAFSDDVIDIANGATIYSAYANPLNPLDMGYIYVANGGIIINNDGIINANIYANNNNFSIRNSGNIYGDIYMGNLGSGATLNQIIQSEADINKLNVSGNYNLVVQMNDFVGMANLNQLKGLDNADVFYITNSGVVMDNFSDWQNWDSEFVLSGVTLYINNPETLKPTEPIAHVINASSVNVVLLNSANLYTLSIQATETGAILNVVRETDYDKVFGNEENDFFMVLRENHIDDKLLAAMDAANNENELRNIMNSSYKINHSVLMRPIRVMNNFSLMNMHEYNNDMGVKFTPSYITSDDFHGYELRLDVLGAYEDWYFDAGVFFNSFNYENSFNDFGGHVYGADFKVRKNIDKFWLAGVGGFSMVHFDADYIYMNNYVKNNPDGFALYGGIDGGYDYVVDDNFIISPFVGVAFQNLKVLDYSDYDVNLRGGGDVKYSFAIDGIKYEYLFGGAVATNGDLFGMFKVGFMSLTDGAGVFVGIDAIKEEYGIGYRASLSGKIVF